MGAIEYVDDARLDAMAGEMLAGYAERFGVKIPSVVPVDGLAESWLDLTLDFTDLRSCCGEGVRGAICVKHRTLWIDESIDPGTYPGQESVYRFTVAHEIGHWLLHRSYLPMEGCDAEGHGPSAAAIRWSGTHARVYDRIEHQANRFAGALLMPKAALLEQWRALTGSDDPQDAAEEFRALGGGTGRFEPVVEVAERMAEPFGVSGFAMQIRLKRLSLLRLAEQAAPSTRRVVATPQR